MGKEYWGEIIRLLIWLTFEMVICMYFNSLKPLWLMIIYLLEV